MLLAFGQVPVPADCLDVLELVVGVVSGAGVEIAVYQSLETTAASFAEGAPIGGGVIRSTRPRATATLTSWSCTGKIRN